MLTTQNNNHTFKKSAQYRKWLKLYRPQFDAINDFHIFIDKCVKADNRVNMILNRGERLIKLADKSRFSSLKIFFLLVCVESIMRISDGKEYKIGISQKSIVNFCESNFCESDKDFFKNSFKNLFHKNENLSFKGIIEFFYKIRCNVAHNGEYWGFCWGGDRVDSVNSCYYENEEGIKKDYLVVKSGVGYQ